MRLLSRAHLLSRPLKPHHHHLSQLRRPFAISSTAHGMRQPPNSDTVNFPGAVQSKFTSDLKFHKPQDATAMPTYRYIDADGVVVDKSRTIEIGQEKALKIYKDMVTTSVMDLIMYESQRQGRISFYMVRALFVAAVLD